MTTVFAFNPVQARVPKGNDQGGQWVDTAGSLADNLSGGSSADLIPPASAKDYKPVNDPLLDSVAKNRNKPGRLEGKGTPDDPIYVGQDLDKAMDLLGEGKYVRIDPNDDDLRVLTDMMAEQSKGTAMDICKVSIGGNLFCSGTKGRPRVTMPQFSSAHPLPGSAAAKAAKDKGGAVNLSDQFKADLTSRGIGISTDRRPAAAYLPAQSEMLASKSAGIAKALRSGKNMPGTVFVSRDGYVIDGHHRWAAVNINTGLGEGDGMMDVEIVDMDITDALHYANQWTEDMGLPHADILGAPVGSEAAKEADQRLAALMQIVFGALTAAAFAGSFNPAQARVARGNRHGGRWLRTAGPIADDLESALKRSMNRLDIGKDIGERELPATAEEVRAERRRMADEILKREGRPGLEETAARVSQIYGMTTPEQRAAGEVWYDEAQQLAQEMVDDPATNLTLDQAAAIIAHTSTQTRWEANADYARSMAAGRTQDEAYAHLKAEVAAGRIPKPRKGGDFLLGTNWAKAEQAAASDNPIGDHLDLGTFSEKNKTRTFADNIRGDRDGVTVDAHMQRVVGQPIMPTGKVKGLPQPIREDQIYESLSEAVRVAADENGISPVEMQAATWGWALASHVDARQGHAGRLVDATTGVVLPDVIGGEQELIDSGDLVAAAEPVPAEDDIPDYYYAMAEKLLGIIPPIDEDSLTAASSFNPAQIRVQKGNRDGGRWLDAAGQIADRLQARGGDAGSADEIPGHERPLVDWDSDEFRSRAEEFSERTGGTFETPQEYCGYGPSYWAEHAYAMTGHDKTPPTIVDVLPEGSTPIYRGLGADRARSEEYIDQFKNGDHFPGKGIFGAGTYFAANREEAGEYAGWLREQDGSPFSDHTDLIKGAMKPGSRVLTIDNDKHGTGPESVNGHMWHLNNIRLATGGQEYIPGAGAIGGMNITRDIGAAAALAGYDALQVTGMGTGDYTVVLNRGAMFVTAENEVE